MGCRREELETSDAKLALDLIRGFSYGTRWRISSMRSEDFPCDRLSSCRVGGIF